VATTVEGGAFLLALGMGPALGGLLICAARRPRGIPFPRHPGEYVLVVEGIFALLSLGTGFLGPLLMGGSDQNDLPFFWFPLWVGLFVLCHLASLVVWFAAGRWIGGGPWRVFFFLCTGAQLLGCCHNSPLSFVIVGHSDLHLLISVLPVILAVREHRRGLRYPWTHWLGLGIWFWFVFLNVASWAVVMFVWMRMF